MQYISLLIISLIYLGASIRYFPGEIARTSLATLTHMISMAPFTIGCTLLIVILFQKISKGKLPWDRVARIFLMLAILFELILGFQNYVGAVS